MGKRHLNGFVKSERGHLLVFEWSYLLLVLLLIISIILPDLVILGKTMFHTHQVASYGIQRAAEQGRLTEEIAVEMERYLVANHVKGFRIYGTGDLRNFGDPVEVQVIGFYQPKIIKIFPDMVNIGDTRVVPLKAHKIDASQVYIRR